MAETAGLLLGIVGTVALYSAWLDAFSQVRQAQSYGRNFEILLTRFDVRKARLLQWGDGVGLLGDQPQERDPRSQQANTVVSVEQVLDCIKLLLNDGESLQSRYGMKRSEEVKKVVTTGVANAVSNTRFRRFPNSYEHFLSRIQGRQRKVSFTLKVKWAICDQDKFRLLISDLDGLIEDLYRLVPVSTTFSRLMIKEDIEALPEQLAILKLVEEACQDDTGLVSRLTCHGAASVRVENSTQGTLPDFRNVRDWLLDIASDNSDASFAVDAAQDDVESLTLMTDRTDGPLPRTEIDIWLTTETGHTMLRDQLHWTIHFFSSLLIPPSDLSAPSMRSDLVESARLIDSVVHKLYGIHGYLLAGRILSREGIALIQLTFQFVQSLEPDFVLKEIDTNLYDVSSMKERCRHLKGTNWAAYDTRANSSHLLNLERALGRIRMTI